MVRHEYSQRVDLLEHINGHDGQTLRCGEGIAGVTRNVLIAEDAIRCTGKDERLIASKAMFLLHLTYQLHEFEQSKKADIEINDESCYPQQREVSLTKKSLREPIFFCSSDSASVRARV